MTIINTVIIYEQFVEPIKFIVVAGDATRFDGLYVNADGNDRALQDEFCDMLYDEVSGEPTNILKNALDKFPVEIVKDRDVAVIVAGFLP